MNGITKIDKLKKVKKIRVKNHLVSREKIVKTVILL